MPEPETSRVDISAIPRSSAARAASSSASTPRSAAPTLSGEGLARRGGTVGHVARVARVRRRDDARLGADVALYAHGEIIPWDHNGSMMPAVAFTLTAHNPAATPMDVSLLLSMPLASQPNTARMTDKGTPHPGATT